MTSNQTTFPSTVNTRGGKARERERGAIEDFLYMAMHYIYFSWGLFIRRSGELVLVESHDIESTFLHCP